MFRMPRLCLSLVLAVSLAGCLAPNTDTAHQQAATDMSERTIIATDQAPAAVGPYSQAVQVGNTVYLAGQVGLDPATGSLVEGGVEAETHQVMANIEAVLTEAGFSLAHVVQAQVFLADLNDYAAMNAIYGSYFDTSPPARAAFEVARLPLDARVEIMVTAAK